MTAVIFIIAKYESEKKKLEFWPNLIRTIIAYMELCEILQMDYRDGSVYESCNFS